MVARNKIDSNETSAFYAEEYNLGILPGENGAPGVAEWHPLEPNEYDDFGGELTLLARNPINSGRQRKKGSITDLEASGGFNQDFTQSNLQDMLQGFMFADFREKATQFVTAVTADGYTVADANGFAAGALVMASGFTNAANNGLKSVTAITGNVIEADGLAVDAAPNPRARVVLVGIVAGAGDLEIDASGVWPVISSTALDFTTYGFIPGEWIYVGGDEVGSSFTTAGNVGFMRIRSVSANALEIDQAGAPLVSEAGAGLSVVLYFGRVLKNELGDRIKRRSYHIERQLGAPETTQPGNVQAEYLKGAVPSEFVFTVEVADKINADLSFVAIDNEQRTATQNIKAGTRVPLIETDAFNTSSDFAMKRLAVIDSGNTAPGDLFGYMTSFTLTINNNLTVNKAIGVLGGFDVTAGTFEVTAEAEAYFGTVEAVQAVRRNEDVNFFMAVAKQNAGFVVDLPLIALGNARLDVAQDEPIMLPLAIDAATAAKINPATDYTLLWTFFDYLPTRAQ